MNKCFLFLGIYAFVAGPQIAEPSPFHFRTANWGMNQNQVKASERARQPDSVSPDVAPYLVAFKRIELLGKTWQLYYYFLNNKLVRALALLEDMPSADPARAQAQNDIRKTLADKYGEPSDERARPKIEGYKAYNLSVWRAIPETLVSFGCENDSCFLSYESKNSLSAVKEACSGAKIVDSIAWTTCLNMREVIEGIVPVE